jgi:hypothetical protein
MSAPRADTDTRQLEIVDGARARAEVSLVALSNAGPNGIPFNRRRPVGAADLPGGPGPAAAAL